MTRHDSLRQRAEEILAERLRQRPVSARTGARTHDGLSPAQERMWFLHAMDPASSAYTILSATRLAGPVDLGALEQAVTYLVARHEMLHSRFPSDAQGRPTRRTDPALAVPVEVADLPGSAPDTTRAVLVRWTAEPFDLGAGPLLRVLLIRVSDTEHVLALALHHIVIDGWGLDVLHRELHDAYAAFTAGRQPDLPAAPAALPAVNARQEDLAYWRQQLDDLPQIELPMAAPRPPVARFAGASHDLHLPETLVHQVERLAKQRHATLFMAAAAGFVALLHRYSGQSEIVVGSPVAGRDDPAVADAVGLFVNTVVLRADLSGNPTFADLLVRMRGTVLDALTHQGTPFEELVADLAPDRFLSHNPLFQVMFTQQNARTTDLTLPGTTSDPVHLVSSTVRVDLECVLWRQADGARVRLAYNRDILTADAIHRMGGHYQRLLEAAVANPDTPIGDLAYLGDSELRRMGAAASTPAAGEPSCVHTLFEQAAAAFPASVAVQTGTECVTFADLDRRAADVARALTARGAGRGAVVALGMGRTADLVAAILGVWKAGAAFVPLNPADPDARRAFVAADCGASLIVTDAAHVTAWDGHQVPVMDISSVPRGESLPVPGPVLEDAAYVLYTSGTTGAPKGVVVEHRQLANTLTACQQQFGFTSHDAGLVLAPATFDVFLFELLAVMLAGGRVILVEQAELFDPARICMVLGEATAFQAVPGLMDHLIRSLRAQDIRSLPRMRHVITGGDTVPATLLDTLAEVFPDAGITVAYGPTETAIFATLHPVGRGTGPVEHPVGRPIAGAEIRIADPAGRWLPDGVAGEIWIGGRGVARGYLSRPEETAARFVTTPGGRFYRSGDRGRRGPDGCVEFLGRDDRQVKIRGHRIELGEVEAVLGRAPGARQAVVVPHGTGPSDRTLTAYLIAAEPPGADAQAENTAVEQWRNLFDHTHQAASPPGGRDFTGWNSSYDDQPIPADEMNEWLDLILARLRRNLARATAARPSVLEIGCGTGAILLELAPECRRYVGVDFSGQVLARLSAETDRRGISHVELHHADADDLPDLGGPFDAVIINSVSQYLPSRAHLERLLARAIRLAPRGFVFVGDVRNLRLLDLYALSVEAARSAGLPPDDLLRRAARRARAQQELLVAPALFTTWAAEHSGQVTGTEIDPRLAEHANELSTYRYDVTLWTISLSEPHTPSWRAWEPEWTEEHLDRALAARPGAMGLTGIPHAFLADTLDLRERLHGSDPDTCKINYSTPRRLDAIAARHGYRLQTSWAASRPDGSFDVCFTSLREDARPVAWAPPDPDPGALTNTPLAHAAQRALAAAVRDYAARHLPAYMMPSVMICLDDVPLTPHGKIDTTALPVPDQAPEAIRRLPHTRSEVLVAEAWTEVLPGSQPGTGDDFFACGGTSLLAIRLSVALRARGAPVPPQRLFELRTVETIAVFLDTPGAGQPLRGSVEPDRNPRPAVRAVRLSRPGPDGPDLLLTGATGMLGIHVLDALARTSPERRVTCLVRGRDDQAAEDRLRDQYSWYFSGRPFPAGLRVLAADLTASQLGLADGRWYELAEAREILHVAADVRHVAPPSEVLAANVDGTARLLDLAAGADGRFHHVSSIAVAGRGPAGTVLTETCLNVGQQPTEPYSRSKIEAERLVRSYLDDGGGGTVLRVGTVAPHSQTGRFQRNIDSHFFSRFIRAILDLRLAADWPGRTFALTPADTMATLILALTADPGDADTFHLTNPHDLPRIDLVRFLQQEGYPIRLVPVDEFTAHVTDLARDPRTADAVGRALPLLSMPPGHPVRLDSTQTLRWLTALGLSYPRPSHAWLRRFLHHGIDVGYFPAPTPPEPAISAPDPRTAP